MSYMLRAVIVGINEYSDPRYREEARLHFAEKDAGEMANVLQTSEAFYKEPDNPRLLIGPNATQSFIRRAMNKTFLSPGLGRNSVVFFYFAGHGIWKDDLIYLCCHDVDFAEPDQAGIRLNDIHDWLLKSSAEYAIAIIDACFSGGLANPRLDFLSAAERARHVLEDLRLPDGKTIVIMTASGKDQEARESRHLKHGVFTHHLLSGWRDGEAGDDDGKIYLFGLTNFITKRFAEKVQNPQIMIRGGTPLVLGYHQKIVSPSEQNQPHPPLSPCKMIPEHDPILHDSQTNVYIQPVLPGPFTLEQIHKRRQIRLAMLIFLLFLILAIGMALITHC